MDSFETFGKACNNASFDSNAKFGKGSRVDSSIDGITKKEIQSQKPLKYFTENPFFQVAPISGVPCSYISAENDIRLGYTGFLSRNRQELGGLPAGTTPGLYRGTVNVDVEDSLRGNKDRESKSCNTKDTTFYDRSFYIFDNLPEKPYGFYADKNLTGADTRFLLKTTVKR
jgi:hypothetical protein